MIESVVRTAFSSCKNSITYLKTIVKRFIKLYNINKTDISKGVDP